MVKEGVETEILIKEAAKRVFFSMGHINASTKEIAKEAGVNRALIHYYFRSRDFLFNMVLEEAVKGMASKIGAIFGSDMELRPKIKAFLDVFIQVSGDFPYLETFMITEMMKNPKKIQELHPKNAGFVKDLMTKQVESEVAAGTMDPIEIDHFIVNLMSMCNYPLIAKPVLQTLLGYDEAAYRLFLSERKKIVYRNIFNEEYPED